MHTKALAAMTAVGLTAAIAIPTIAFGNARSNLGSFSFQQVANTPLTARLSGANELPPADPDGSGAASVTVDVTLRCPSSQVCWDLTYSNITSHRRLLLHLHQGGPTVNGLPVVSFTGLGASSATGCATVAPALATEIVDDAAELLRQRAHCRLSQWRNSWSVE